MKTKEELKIGDRSWIGVDHTVVEATVVSFDGIYTFYILPDGFKHPIARNIPNNIYTTREEAILEELKNLRRSRDVTKEHLINYVEEELNEIKSLDNKIQEYLKELEEIK